MQRQRQHEEGQKHRQGQRVSVCVCGCMCMWCWRGRWCKSPRLRWQRGDGVCCCGFPRCQGLISSHISLAFASCVDRVVPFRARQVEGWAPWKCSDRTTEVEMVEMLEGCHGSGAVVLGAEDTYTAIPRQDCLVTGKMSPRAGFVSSSSSPFSSQRVSSSYSCFSFSSTFFLLVRVCVGKTASTSDQRIDSTPPLQLLKARLRRSRREERDTNSPLHHGAQTAGHVFLLVCRIPSFPLSCFPPSSSL